MEDGVTPSGQLTFDLKTMSLGSQHGGSTQERPPVPLFAAAGAHLSQPEVALSQQDFLGTPDFITPVDQFQLEYDPANKDARHQRSPARLSPNRNKRARKAGEDVPSMDCSQGQEPCSQGGGGGSVGPSGSRLIAVGNPYAPQGRRVMVRPPSPPCYRNVFDGDVAEGHLVGERRARPVQHYTSRFRLDFKETGLLGQGAFSKVFSARHRLDGHDYAVKRSVAEVELDSAAFKQWVQEVQALRRARAHPNVVEYFGAWREPGEQGGEHLFIQLERCTSNLAVHATLGDALKEAELLEVLRHVCAALAHLHARGVAHMDVKPDNIYLVHAEDDAFIYKLGDFGQATNKDGRGPAAIHEGDSRYLPREVMNGSHQLDKADMFALGITLYELAMGAVGRMPSSGPRWVELREGKVGLMPSTSMPLQNMIKMLLSPNPDSRPSAEEVLRSALLQGRNQPARPPQPQDEIKSQQSKRPQSGAASTSTQSAQTEGAPRLGPLNLQRSAAN